jgi:uncharacterized protein (UPF0276 family)
VQAGIGLKTPHVRQVLDLGAGVDFFEVHAENHLAERGPMARTLERVRQDWPVSIHGVGLSLGGSDPLDETHLQRIARLIHRIEPFVFSEHLAWNRHDGVCFPDLLPVPLDRPTLDRVCARVAHVQERLGSRILIENPSTYVAFRQSEMSTACFLSELSRRTGCGLLLDVNNAYVSGINHGEDPWSFIAALPREPVAQMHLAGFTEERGPDATRLLIDTHGSPVDDAVWALYRRALGHFGNRPTLIERDNDIPPLADLEAEAATVCRLMAAASASAPTPVPGAMVATA